MACRSACKTQDHATWGECARAAELRVSAIAPHNQEKYDHTHKELRAYRQARSEGIQPEGTTMAKIEQAKAATKALGRPYNADADPPARLISTKKAASYVNRTGGDAA